MKALKSETMNLRAEIIRLKTELEDRCLVIADLKKQDHDFRNEMQEVFNDLHKAKALKDRYEAECQQWARLCSELQTELADLKSESNMIAERNYDLKRELAKAQEDRAAKTKAIIQLHREIAERDKSIDALVTVVSGSLDGLAELRGKVTRYFTYKDRSEKLWIKQKQTRLTTNESYFTAKKKIEAEQHLRKMIEGEDG